MGTKKDRAKVAGEKIKSPSKKTFASKRTASFLPFFVEKDIENHCYGFEVEKWSTLDMRSQNSRILVAKRRSKNGRLRPSRETVEFWSSSDIE